MSPFKLALVILALSLSGSAQIMQQGVGNAHAPATNFPAITLGIHGVHNNGASSVTTTVISGTDWAGSNATPTAGSTIVCWGKSTNAGQWDTVTDNVNSGNYQPLLARLRDAGHNFDFAAWYKENVAASATTVTMTAASGANQILACEEWIGVPTSYGVDANFLYSRGATSTNPAYSASVTPTNANEVVIAGMEGSASSVTAGFGTIVDSAGTLWPQYSIQTTATGTTGNYTKSASSDYAIGLAALARNAAWSCDATMVTTWNGTGATAGNIPAAADMNAGTFGFGPQPGAEVAVGSALLGWNVTGSGTGLTYSATAYVPLPVAQTCPFYSGSATGTLGVVFDASAGTNHGIEYIAYSQVAKASVRTCVSTDLVPASNASKGIDLLMIHGSDFSLTGEGNGDYAALQLNVSSGGVGKWAIEAPGGNSAASTTSWTNGTNYGVLLTYNQAGIHTAKIYNGCAAGATLLDTISTTGSVSGGASPDLITIIGAANTYTSGHIYFGALEADFLYGSSL